MLISGSFAIILLLILCKVKVKHYSLVESFSLPFCLFLYVLFLFITMFAFPLLSRHDHSSGSRQNTKEFPYLPLSKSS